jgi:outer membrane protein assembly factor BamB
MNDRYRQEPLPAMNSRRKAFWKNPALIAAAQLALAAALLSAADTTVDESRAVAAAAPVFKSRPGDWAMWGGSPSRNMVNLAEKGIPQSWDIKTGKNIKWVADLGSQSFGNPVAAEGKIFVGTNNQLARNPQIKGDKGVLMCFRESDGKFLWQAVHDKLESGRVNDWPEQGICSSPAVEDGKVYYVSNRAEVVCADVEGFLDGENDGPYKDEKYASPLDADFIWILDMFEDLAVFPHNMAASSPLIVGDILYVVTSNGVEKDHITIPSPNAPSFLAIDKHTGKIVWQSSDPGDKILHGQWSSPSYIVAGGKPEIVFPGGDGWLRGMDPLTGKIFWKFDMNPKDSVWLLGGKGTKNNIIATPVWAGGRIFLAVGQDPEHGEGVGNFYAIDPTGSGDITESGKVWHVGGTDFNRTIASAAVHDGLVYAADLSGYLYCFDEKTGKLQWRHDMESAVWASPAWIDGKIYLGDENGDVEVLQAGKTLQKLATNSMGNSVYTTSMASHGVLYITNKKQLYAIAEKS